MQVNQEDYEDKLDQINRLNREVQALRLKVDTIKHQRDTIMDCLVEVYELSMQTIENKAFATDIKKLVANARQTMGQSETM